MNILKISFLLLTAFLAGCASDVANRYYGQTRYSPKLPSEVEVLTEKPLRDFVILADFQSRGDSAQSLKKKAAKLGADAVIISYLGGVYNKSDEWANTDSMSRTYSRITGTAIKYR